MTQNPGRPRRGSGTPDQDKWSRADPHQVAQQFGAGFHPRPLGVILGGSASQGLASTNSDLDVVVVQPGDSTLRRESVALGGWTVDGLVVSDEGLRELWRAEIESRWCPVLRICAEGVLVLDTGGRGQQLQSRARTLLEAGPPELSVGEAGWRTTVVRALVDDLEDSTEDLEQQLVAAALMSAAAELAALMTCGWVDQGKWLARRLSAAAPNRADQLAAASAAAVAGRDTAPLVCFSRALVREAQDPTRWRWQRERPLG